MKGKAGGKVVTSGRLTGGVKVQPARRRVTPNPRAAAAADCPEPAYSLHSTDSEDQVTSLHKGLDRCAALLGGLLRAEKAEALPSLPRAVKARAAKSRPSTSLGRKTAKNPPTKTARQSCPSVQQGSGSTAPTATHQPAVASARSDGKLHPPHAVPQCHSPPSPSQARRHLSPTTPPPQPQTSVPPPNSCPHSGRLTSPPEAAHGGGTAECDSREEEPVPVRDIGAPSTAVRHTHSHVPACIVKTASVPLEPGQADEVPQDTCSGEDCSAETEGKTVQYLLGELKALIAGQGSVAERLLSHLEQAVSSALVNVGRSNVQTEPDLSSLHSQNTQLRRRVRTLNQQLKERERAERRHSAGTLCTSEGKACASVALCESSRHRDHRDVNSLVPVSPAVPTLQEELAAAQCRLHDLQGALAELREALRHTQSQLSASEAENALTKTELKATRSRLLDIEQEKSELASLAQQRLEEIGNLNRILLRWHPSDSLVADAVLPKRHSSQQEHRPEPAEAPADRIARYLMSLGQPEHVAAEREGNTLEQTKPTSGQKPSHPDARLRRGASPPEAPARHRDARLDPSHCSDEVQSRGRRSNSTLCRCDGESVRSGWSTRSGSSFGTREEAAFRDGLAALDASIASLQRTIQLDLGR